MRAGTHVTRTTANLIATGTALAVTAICPVILLHPASAPIVTWFGGWEPRNGVPIGVDFAVDGVGAGLAVFIAVLTSSRSSCSPATARPTRLTCRH